MARANPTVSTVIAMDQAADRLEEAVGLWERCGLTRPWNDARADVSRALDGPSSTVLAVFDDTSPGQSTTGQVGPVHRGTRGGSPGADQPAVEQTTADQPAVDQPAVDQPSGDQPAGRGTLIGTVMVGHDGHRGWVYYLAVDPARRGEGIGRALMEAAQAWLVRRGVPKVQLMVRATNLPVVAFYERLGYADQECLVLGRRFDGDATQEARAAGH